MYAYIYSITNLINSKVYIGFTNNPEKRYYEHTYAAMSGSKCILHKSMRKYGIENFKFEILYQSLDSNHCLDVMENYFILKYNSYYITGHGYNMTLGGKTTKGFKYTNKQKKQIGERSSGKNNYFYGKHLTDEHKNKISNSLKGISHSKERRKNISKNHADMSGEKNPFHGRKHSEDAKQKMRDGQARYRARMKQNLSCNLEVHTD